MIDQLGAKNMTTGSSVTRWLTVRKLALAVEGKIAVSYGMTSGDGRRGIENGTYIKGCDADPPTDQFRRPDLATRGKR
jgi:hypothetical protein